MTPSSSVKFYSRHSPSFLFASAKRVCSHRHKLIWKSGAELCCGAPKAVEQSERESVWAGPVVSSLCISIVLSALMLSGAGNKCRRGFISERLFHLCPGLIWMHKMRGREKGKCYGIHLGCKCVPLLFSCHKIDDRISVWSSGRTKANERVPLVARSIFHWSAMPLSASRCGMSLCADDRNSLDLWPSPDYLPFPISCSLQSISSPALAYQPLNVV